MLTVEREAGNANRHDHGERDAQVFPVGAVVTCPDGPNALSASKECTAEYKRPVCIRAIHCLAALNEPLGSSTQLSGNR